MNCLLCNRRFFCRPSWQEVLGLGKLNEPAVCPTCWEQFCPYPSPHCPGCGRTTDADQLCGECSIWDQQLGWHLHHRCLFQYNTAMKEYMHLYKFQGDYSLRNVFRHFFTDQVKQVAADIVCPVPISDHTWQTRGFNQVTGLLDLPVTQLLSTVGQKKRPQSSRSRQERLTIAQPFRWLNRAAKELVKGKQVLIVDDVYTTGRTIYYAADLIREGGVKSVKTLSLAG